jgi:hypothetical protein
LHNLVREAEFWASPDFSRNTFGGFPDVLRSAEERFVDLYRSQLRPFEAETRWHRGWSSVAPAATPAGTAWSAWRLAATG